MMRLWSSCIFLQYAYLHYANIEELLAQQHISTSKRLIYQKEPNSTIFLNAISFCQTLHASGMRTSELLEESLRGSFGGIGDPRKHLLGMYLMIQYMNKHHTINASFAWAADSLYDSSQPGWPSPDELHGAVWHAMVASSPSSNLSFWQLSMSLCWFPSRSTMLYTECFHGVGHAAVLLALKPARPSGQCLMLKAFAISSLLPFKEAKATCASRCAPLGIYVNEACLDGVYHSQRQYLQPSLFGFMQCKDTRDAAICLKYYHPPANWYDKPSSLQFIVGLYGCPALAFIRIFSSVRYFHHLKWSTQHSANSAECRKMMKVGHDDIATPYRRWLWCIRGMTQSYPWTCKAMAVPNQFDRVQAMDDCQHSVFRGNTSAMKEVSVSDAIQGTWTAGGCCPAESAAE